MESAVGLLNEYQTLVAAYYWTDFVIQSIKGSDLDVVAPPKCHSFGLAILVYNRDYFNTILTFCSKKKKKKKKNNNKK